MNCPSCGHLNPDIARLCRNCGTALYVTCPSCNTENPAARTFCTNCNHQLREMAAGGVSAQGSPIIYEQGRPAGFFIRLGASIIDGILIGAVALIITLPFLGFDGLLKDGQLSNGVQYTNIIIGAVYAVPMVALMAGTLGVLLLRMRVLRPDGAYLGPGRSLARYVVLLLSSVVVIPLIISAIMVAFRADKRSIHDLVCDTVVVIRSQPESGSAGEAG